MKRQQNPLSTLAIYAVSAGLAAVGIAGFVRGRKILKGTGPEIKKVQIKEGAVQSPDDQTMRSGWPKGSQYTSFFTPGVEASLEGQFMAWRNNNQIQVCDLITGYIPDEFGGITGGKYLLEAAEAAEYALNSLYAEGAPWNKDDFVQVKSPQQAETTVGLWRWWLWYRTLAIANEFVCGFTPVT